MKNSDSNSGFMMLEAAIFFPVILLAAAAVFLLAMITLDMAMDEYESKTASESLAMRFCMDEKRTGIVLGGSLAGDATLPDDDELAAYYSYQNTYEAMFLNTKQNKNLVHGSRTLSKGNTVNLLPGSLSGGVAEFENVQDGMNRMILSYDRYIMYPEIFGMIGLDGIFHQKKNYTSVSADCAELIRAYDLNSRNVDRTFGVPWFNGRNDISTYISYFDEVLARYRMD